MSGGDVRGGKDRGGGNAQGGKVLSPSFLTKREISGLCCDVGSVVVRIVSTSPSSWAA